MAVQVFRIETRHQVDAKLIAHYRGDTRAVEARERSEDKLPPVVVFSHDPDGARAALRAAKAKPGRGRPGTVELVDCLFAGPPPYDSPGAWKTEKVHDWANRSLAWFRERAPDAVVVGAYLHQDERSPHLHLVAIPIAKGGRLSWNRTEKGFADDPSLKGGAVFTSAQTRYHREIADHFGLERGEIGSKRRHEPINRERGLVERVLETPYRWSDRQRAQAAQVQVKAADRKRNVAVERRLEVEAQRDRALADVAAATVERDQGLRDRDQAILDRDQVCELLAVTEAKRDQRIRELERDQATLRDVQRDRDQATREKSAALDALSADRDAHEADRNAHAKVCSSWKEELKRVGGQLAESRLRLRARPVPPSVAALNKARAAATVADQARREAIVERDAAVAQRDAAVEQHANLSRSVVGTMHRESAERTAEKADARAAGVLEGVEQGKGHIEAAVERAKTVERGAAKAVEHADQSGFERGGAKSDTVVKDLRAEVKRLGADLERVQAESAGYKTERDAVWTERDELVDELGQVQAARDAWKASRDELWAERTEGRTHSATPVRPAGARAGGYTGELGPGDRTVHG